MKDVHYSTIINAPKEKVWDTMLGESTYQQWASVFMPGSYYKGNWQKGSEIDFLAPDEGGVESGMRAYITECKPYQFVSMKHLAELKGSEELPFTKEGESFENYTFKDRGDTTEVSVDLLNIPDEWVEMMGEAWPQALKTLKELTEA